MFARLLSAVAVQRCSKLLLTATHTQNRDKTLHVCACVCEHPVWSVRVCVLWFGYLQQALPLVVCKIKLFRLVKRALISLRVCVCICVCGVCLCVQRLSAAVTVIAAHKRDAMWHVAQHRTHTTLAPSSQNFLLFPLCPMLFTTILVSLSLAVTSYSMYHTYGLQPKLALAVYSQLESLPRTAARVRKREREETRVRETWQRRRRNKPRHTSASAKI